MRNIGHTLLQYKKRNRLLRGGASAHEITYKVECALLVKKLNAIEVFKSKDKKPKIISKSKENIGQNFDDYL